MKYIIRPGFITSRTDGQTHYVTAQQLLRLYCVPKNADIIEHKNKHENVEVEKDDIVCFPRYDGKYPLFEKNK